MILYENGVEMSDLMPSEMELRKSIYHMEELIENYDTNQYHSIADPIDKIIYVLSDKSATTKQDIGFDVSDEYYSYGCYLTGKHKFKKAEAIIKKALMWNPVSKEAMLELSTIYAAQGKKNEMRDIATEALKTAKNYREIAKAYRNLGFYYYETKNYELSAALYLYSTDFVPTEVAAKELRNIRCLTGMKIENFTMAIVKKLITDNGIQYGFSDTVMTAIALLAKAKEKSGEYVDALRYYYKLKVLSRSNRFDSKIKEINRKCEQEY